MNIIGNDTWKTQKTSCYIQDPYVDLLAIKIPHITILDVRVEKEMLIMFNDQIMAKAKTIQET